MAYLKHALGWLVFHSLYRLKQVPVAEGVVTLRVVKRWSWAPDLGSITVKLGR